MDLELLRHIFKGLRRDELIVLTFAAGNEMRDFYFASVDDIVLEGEVPAGVHCYFGVCPRKQRTRKKAGVSRGLCTWVDLDSKDFEAGKAAALQAAHALVLPPSFVVDTGNGFHAYWLLERGAEVEPLEKATRELAEYLGGDKAFDASRLLRIPGTLNWKDPADPKPCEVVEAQPSLRYELKDLVAAAKVPPELVARVLTGSADGYQSRSERDWAVIRGLLQARMSDAAIEQVFTLHPVGDKLRDVPPKGGAKYFQRTLKRAKQKGPGASEFLERSGCLYIQGREGLRQVSTFLFRPTRLLEGPAEDLLVGDMEAAGFHWDGIVLPRSAFTSVARLTSSLPIASWQWLGSDREVRMLLPHLMDALYLKGLPKAVATYVIGRHDQYFVTQSGVLSPDGPVPPEASPYVYVETGREYPAVVLKFPPKEDYQALLARLFGLIPKLNQPGVVWPILSWFMAAPYKAPLGKLGVRFPVLNVYGTRGAGKTSLLLYVMQPLLGVAQGRSYSCATTPFVLLSLLASTNAIPVSFSEFRRSTLSQQAYDKLMRYLLLAYDVGRDARGRPDQTTTVYPLDAPFTLDGEDALSTPAALERTILVNMAPESIEAGTPAFEAYQEYTKLPASDFAGRYLQHTLNFDVQGTLFEARALVDAAFQRRLPERVRNNLTVCAFGYYSLHSFLDRWGVPLFEPDPRWFTATFEDVAESIVSARRGRTPIILDEFVEDVVNAVVGWRGAEGQFHYRVSATDNQVWFHLRTAHSWWLAKRRREGLPVLDQLALKQQLRERELGPRRREGDYILSRRTQRCAGRGASMYGVDIAAAYDSGLDITNSLGFLQEVIISYRKEEASEETP